MRRLVVLVALVNLVACDLQPSKREKAAAKVAPVEPPAEPAEPPVNRLPPNAGTVDAGVMKPPTIETTEACTEVAAYITNKVIESIDDPTAKAVQEQDRTRTIRRVAETCTTSKWSDEARACMLASKTPQAIEDCGRRLAPQPTPSPALARPPSAAPGPLSGPGPSALRRDSE